MSDYRDNIFVVERADAEGPPNFSLGTFIVGLLFGALIGTLVPMAWILWS